MHFRYVSTFFVCLFPLGTKLSTISLATESTLTDPVNNMVISPTAIGTDNRRNITACLSPLHNQFNDVNYIIQWIEMNRLLGIEYFIIYVTNATQMLINVLEFYKAKNLAEIISWPITKAIKLQDIDYNGQQAALNDCLYRNKPKSKYVITIDLDELIVPQKYEDFTVQNMIGRLPTASSYMLKHLTFYKTKTGKHVGSDIYTSDDMLRAKDIQPPRIRSKVIVATKDVTSLAVHDTWILHKGLTYMVPQEFGLLHHYKEDLLTDGLPQKDVPVPIKNHATLKYRNDLIRNIKDVKDSLHKECNITA